MQLKGSTIDESVVTAFEQRLGHRLPDDYRRFLIEVNGGRPGDTHRRASFGVMNWFFSLADPDDERSLAGANSGIPELPSRDLLCVGYDGSGTDVFVVIAGERRGQVWMQDTEDPRPADANPRVLWHDRRDMEKIADSFSEFMRQLGPLER
ncbi:MAG TPA: SMI1/KNR4 family protein [Kofleriaceae bacterium]|nr:SMI1/KNR4 family protein [Kofleriaceae bacterium]